LVNIYSESDEDEYPSISCTMSFVLLVSFDEVLASWHIGMCERARREQIPATVDKMCV
jgi:hypothetical protein